MHYPFLRRTIIPLLLKRIRVEGLEHVPIVGPYLIVANHQSYLDAVIMVFPLIIHRDHKVWFLTTEHIWKFFKRFGGSGILRWLGMIPIVNSQKAQSLKPSLEVLARGGVIGIFPEGMRNKPSVNPDWQRAMLKGRTGAARLALLSGVPVLPAGITAPKGLTVFQALKNFVIPFEPAIIRFGRPLSFSKIDDSSITKHLLLDVTQQIMHAIAKLSGKAYPY